MNDEMVIPHPTGDEATAEALVSAYRAEDFLFSSPTRALLAGDWLDTRSPRGDQGEQALAELLELGRRAGIDNPRVVGALPFADDRHGRLLLPRRCTEHCALTDWAAQQAEPALDARARRVTPHPDRAGYSAGVEAALAEFRAGRLDKVVLARTLEVETDGALDPTLLLRRLLHRNPEAYVFATPLEARQSPAVFLGASPELMVRRIGRRVMVNPLAGSTARRRDPEEDRLAAAALLRSDKDLREHALVIDAVVAALRPFCSQLEVPEGPTLLSTGKLWHLSTELSGELIEPAPSSLAIARALHPTPAVCGHPNAAAFATIRRLEPFERELFSGLVGWCDASGDGEWALSLRCAELRGEHLTLYAGAGLVEGSTAASEFAETGTKLGTMLAALGLDDSLGQASTTSSTPGTDA
ncbi:isochorismate synthase [Halotalea alkalilenta]|uniref:isochorismate synthase n=1 Tax=Halotalea alkalilenta TaxID=376489 RepID=UPI000693F8F7|nr:isochorismate synthase [Halotalea alkalilenta]